MISPLNQLESNKIFAFTAHFFEKRGKDRGVHFTFSSDRLKEAMTILGSFPRMISTALLLAVAFAVPAMVAPAVNAADCYAIGQKVADQSGGTLAKATPDTQDGKPVCRIVVLLPAKEGERPRRTEIVVPQN